MESLRKEGLVLPSANFAGIAVRTAGGIGLISGGVLLHKLYKKRLGIPVFKPIKIYTDNGEL